MEYMWSVDGLFTAVRIPFVNCPCTFGRLRSIFMFGSRLSSPTLRFGELADQPIGLKSSQSFCSNSFRYDFDYGQSIRFTSRNKHQGFWPGASNSAAMIDSCNQKPRSLHHSWQHHSWCARFCYSFPFNIIPGDCKLQLVFRLNRQILDCFDPK